MAGKIIEEVVGYKPWKAPAKSGCRKPDTEEVARTAGLRQAREKRNPEALFPVYYVRNLSTELPSGGSGVRGPGRNVDTGWVQE